MTYEMGSLTQIFEVFAHFIVPPKQPKIQAFARHKPMTPVPYSGNGSEPYVSIAIFAWNEERAIPATLESLFQQSLFEKLQQRGLRSEVICVTNGCTDRTPEVAAEVFDRQIKHHPGADSFSARVAEVPERGKVNAWNQFVHMQSSRSARFLFMMDADILIHRVDTLWNMVQTLEKDPRAHIAVDRPCKHLEFKERKSVRDRLSLAAAQSTLSADAQLCGQLYCMRAEVARSIYLPKDLAACEDGFIKAMVCTDLLAHEVWPDRIRVAENAAHTFEAYTSPAAILKNQKRQIIGQTIVHILVDKYLKELPIQDRKNLVETLKSREAKDPAWLKRLIRDHLQNTRYFWQIHPDLLGLRFKRLSHMRPMRRVTGFPAAAIGAFASLLASFLAYRTLKAGCTNYWPKASRGGLGGADALAGSATNG